MLLNKWVDGRHVNAPPCKPTLDAERLNAETSKYTVMKKIILVMAAAVAFCLTASAQDSKAPVAKKFFMAITGGPALPVGAFAANDLNKNEEAGMAKTGYQVGLHFGYKTNSNLSVIAQVFYGKHGIDNTMFHEVGADMDHWQYYGILAGPALTVQAGKSKKVEIDFKTLAGWARVNSPLVKMSGTTLVNEDWSDAMALQGGIDVRYTLSGNLFFFGGANYNYMRPKFKFDSILDEEPAEEVEQKIGFVNINAGIGFRF